MRRTDKAPTAPASQPPRFRHTWAATRALSPARMPAIADMADFIHQIAEPKQPRQREMRVSRGKPGADRVIAELAARQHGVVARRQLFAVGLSRGAVDRRLASGRLHTLHQAVYAVGQPRIAGPGRLLAAVLACGDEALLSPAVPPPCGSCCPMPAHGSTSRHQVAAVGAFAASGSIALAALIRRAARFGTTSR